MVTTDSASAPQIRAEFAHTKMPDRRALLIERSVVIALIVIPMAGAVLGLALLIGGHIGFQDHVLFAAMYLVSGFGVTIGYHRLFAHRAFETPTPFRIVLAIAGAMAFQGPVIRWVGDHRRHHAFTDRIGDPHSPVISKSGGQVGRWRGLLHAHVGWLLDDEKTVVRHYAADLVRDPLISWIDRCYPWWLVLSLAIPGAIGYAISGNAAGAWCGVVWAGFTRIFVVQHVTWAVNSICHTFGRQPLPTGDASRNHAIMAVLALGEGLHNNHHADPTAAIHGTRRGELDPSGFVIEMLERFRIVWGVRRPRVSDREPPSLELSRAANRR